MEIFFSILTTAIMLLFAFWYSRKTFAEEIRPALSTWIIMLIGTLLSFATFIAATDKNLLSGVLNIADVIVSVLILTSVLIKLGFRSAFKPFEKWYLLICSLIVVFWILSGDAFISNLLVQGVILVGYFPTIHKLVSEKKNTESFFAWSIALSAGFMALYPAISNQSTLSIIYVMRTIVMQSVIIFLMYNYRSQKN